MEFHSTAAVAGLPGPGEPMPNVPQERFCTDEGYIRLDALVGNWASAGDPTSDSGARLVAAPFNAGCAVMAVLTQGADRPRTFYAWTYVPDHGARTQLSLEDSREATHRLWVEEEVVDGQEELVFEANDGLVIRDELEALDLGGLMPATPRERAVWLREGGALRIKWEKVVAEKWRSERELELRGVAHPSAD